MEPDHLFHRGLCELGTAIMGERWLYVTRCHQTKRWPHFEVIWMSFFSCSFWCWADEQDLSPKEIFQSTDRRRRCFEKDSERSACMTFGAWQRVGLGLDLAFLLIYVSFIFYSSETSSFFVVFILRLCWFGFLSYLFAPCLLLHLSLLWPISIYLLLDKR